MRCTQGGEGPGEHARGFLCESVAWGWRGEVTWRWGRAGQVHCCRRRQKPCESNPTWFIGHAGTCCLSPNRTYHLLEVAPFPALNVQALAPALSTSSNPFLPSFAFAIISPLLLPHLPSPSLPPCRGDFGRLGHGHSGDMFVPHPVRSLCGQSIKLIACGDCHCIAILQDGKVYR